MIVNLWPLRHRDESFLNRIWEKHNAKSLRVAEFLGDVSAHSASVR